MIDDMHLEKTVKAFNNRKFADAVRQSAEGLAQAPGRDEVFWMGLHEACEGYDHLSREELPKAEQKLVGALQKMRTFGYRYHNFEVTSALAGFRLSVEEIRAVRARRKRIFDVSLLPQLKLAAKADD